MWRSDKNRHGYEQAKHPDFDGIFQKNIMFIILGQSCD
jgi:hypothetical protein